MVEHDLAAARQVMARAVVLDPDEPGYRFLLGALELKRGRAAVALSHLEAALEHETGEFRRGLWALWTARAAEAAKRPARAQALRAELSQSRHPDLAAIRREAVAEMASPRRLRDFRNLMPNFMFVDLH
jgi:hypothetical protein